MPERREALVKITTARFGTLEVEKKDIISFQDGILGFENLKRFFIVDPGDNTLILWLQSVDDGDTALPIIEPRVFKPDYTVKLVPAELNSLELQNLNNAGIYTILTIPQPVTEMSANLKAPIIINNITKSARQIVLQDNKLEVKHSMYMTLKQYICNVTSDDSRRTNHTEKTMSTSEETPATMPTRERELTPEA